MKELNFLKKICEAHAPSGKENWIYPIINEGFKEFGEVNISKLNNIYIHKKGKGLGKIMIMAHTDEVFLIISNIDDDGFLELKSIGIDAKSLISQEVIIHGKEKLFGIVALKGDFNSSKDDSVRMENLYIDTGYPKNKLKDLIGIGDYVTLKRNMIYLTNNNVSCKAIDNRVGIAAMHICAEELKNVNHDLDIYFVCSCQEEVGHRGAGMASYEISPDIGIAIDVTFDGGNLGDVDRENKLGKGPVICIGPNIHPKVRKKLVDVAEDYNIEYQIEVEPGNTGTDAWDIQTSIAGVPTLLISIPIKYMHTSVEIANLQDIRNTGKMLAKFIQVLNSDELEGLFCF